MEEARKDPRLVAISVHIYHRLVVIYPPSFKDEYAQHMVQVFRDRSLDTYRHQGVTGMPRIWAETLIDLIKTVSEEHLQRGVTMTRDTFIRLSGWALIVGVVLIILSIMGLADESRMRMMLYDLLGPPATTPVYYQVRSIASVATGILWIGGPGFITLGLLGLQLSYGRKTGNWGRLFLWISIASGILATFTVVGWTLIIDLSWELFFWALVAMLLSLGLFGVVATREKPMPRGNFLPLLAGLPAGLWAAVTATISAVTGTEVMNSLPLLSQALQLLTVVSLIALGFVLAASPVGENNGPQQDVVMQVPAK